MYVSKNNLMKISCSSRISSCLLQIVKFNLRSTYHHTFQLMILQLPNNLKVVLYVLSFCLNEIRDEKMGAMSKKGQKDEWFLHSLGDDRSPLKTLLDNLMIDI